MSRLHATWQLWWVKVLAVWALTRAIGTALFLWLSTIQGQSYWNPAHPGYFDLINIWDVEWYHRIYDYGFGDTPGYSTVLPTNPDGTVQQNAWAFMPLFPLVVRLVNLLTGLDFKFAAPLVSTLASFGLALVLYKVFRLKFSASVSLWAIFWFGVSVASTVLQTGYAESLGLLFQALALYWLMRRRYWLSLVPLALLSITRPGMIAFALMIGGIWLVRFMQARNQAAKNLTTLNNMDAFGRREQIKVAAVAAIAAALGYLWPTVAWCATGIHDAYFLSEMAWRSWLGTGYNLVLVQPWFFSAQQYFGGLGWLAVLLVWSYGIWLLFTPSVRALGYELRLWVASYFLYLILVFYPQSSTFRILLPVFPLAAAFANRTKDLSRLAKSVLVVTAVILQMIWLSVTWFYASPDYTPP